MTAIKALKIFASDALLERIGEQEIRHLRLKCRGAFPAGVVERVISAAVARKAAAKLGDDAAMLLHGDVLGEVLRA